MTAEMIETKTPKSIETPETEIRQEHVESESWFHSLSRAEKRFHVLFYSLAGLTGILIVQLIWQIAVLTANR
jgi:hypothetical protein